MYSPILRQLDSANFLTLWGFLISFLSVCFAIKNQFYLAIIFIIIAGIIDLFDGFVARKIERNSLQFEAGKQLDSLIDLCSFGFGPALFAYCFGLEDIVSIIILMIYISANALRLAYFNSNGLASQGNEEYFTGLPVTYSALFIPLVFILSVRLPEEQMKWILDGVYLILAIAMVSHFKILKLRGIWYSLFAIGAIGLSSFYTWIIITGN